MSDLILYTSEDGQSRIQLRAEGQTVWLTRLEMAELFQTRKQNIAKHLKAIFADCELHTDSVVNQWLTTESAGKRYQTLSAGFRLRQEATIKQSLTVQTGDTPQATAEESSVVQMAVRAQVRRPANMASLVRLGQSFSLQEQAA